MTSLYKSTTLEAVSYSLLQRPNLTLCPTKYLQLSSRLGKASNASTSAREFEIGIQYCLQSGGYFMHLPLKGQYLLLVALLYLIV